MEADPVIEPVVPSPCVGLCELDADTGLCRGCSRTMDEIAGWPTLGAAEKRRVLDRLARRRVGLHPTRP